MRGLLPLTLLAIFLAVAGEDAVAAAAVVPHFAFESGPGDFLYCAIGVGDSQPALAEQGAQTISPMTTSDGETGFRQDCGVADAFFFGGDLGEQYFAAEAGGTAILVGKVGVMRGYAAALAATFPDSYGPPFTPATNVLSATAGAGLGAFFVDVITPPPTQAAPNPGDPTSLIITPVLDVDCNRTMNSFMQADIVISLCAADQFRPDSCGPLDPGFIFWTGGLPLGTCPDPFNASPYTVSGLQVGTPVVMRVQLSIAPFVDDFANPRTGSAFAEVSALSTATALVTTTDGDPVTGASGHSYVAVPPLPDLTAPPTTTTTVPTPTTTTTLPGCGSMCGNGTVDAACGETCDCPPTADPVLAAYGCSGAAIVPAQQDCIVCRGCQTLDFCLPSVTTTTTTSTTLPGATTTTSTIGGGPTTTTSLPPLPCAGLLGLSRARCALEAALGAPLCGNDAIPAPVDHALRTKLEAADSALGSAVTASAKKAKKLGKRAASALGAASARAARAVKAKNSEHHISSTCAATIARLAATISQEIAGQ